LRTWQLEGEELGAGAGAEFAGDLCLDTDTGSSLYPATRASSAREKYNFSMGSAAAPPETYLYKHRSRSVLFLIHIW
jgi:hypothetical protein